MPEASCGLQEGVGTLSNAQHGFSWSAAASSHALLLANIVCDRAFCMPCVLFACLAAGHSAPTPTCTCTCEITCGSPPRACCMTWHAEPASCAYDKPGFVSDNQGMLPCTHPVTDMRKRASEDRRSQHASPTIEQHYLLAGSERPCLQQ